MRNWEYELKTFICLYVYWQLARATYEFNVDRGSIYDFAFLRGPLRCRRTYRVLAQAACVTNGNDTFILTGE